MKYINFVTADFYGIFELISSAIGNVEAYQLTKLTKLESSIFEKSLRRLGAKFVKFTILHP